MTEPSPPVAPRLLFTEDEWDQAMPKLCTEMVAFLRRYRTPVFIDHGDHGLPNGSGSFLEIDGRKFVLTNEHVARPKRLGAKLGIRFDSQEDLLVITGDHAEMPWPWDLALLPITDEGWSLREHTSLPIAVD